MNYRFALVIGAAALTGALVLGSQSAAQIKKGKTRPLTTKRLMAGLVGPSTNGLRQDLQAGPADDKAWEALAAKAELLNESAHVMMQDGRCPDATWAGACKSLDEATAALLAKIEAKDASGARESLTAVGAACKSCHMAHKK